MITKGKSSRVNANVIGNRLKYIINRLQMIIQIDIDYDNAIAVCVQLSLVIWCVV